MSGRTRPASARQAKDAGTTLQAAELAGLCVRWRRGGLADNQAESVPSAAARRADPAAFGSILLLAGILSLLRSDVSRHTLRCASGEQHQNEQEATDFRLEYQVLQVLLDDHVLHCCHRDLE